jgi:hypothetical protein
METAADGLGAVAEWVNEKAPKAECNQGANEGQDSDEASIEE